MTKQELIDKLTGIYFTLENALEDESVLTIGKVLIKEKDKLGEIVQTIEDNGIEE